MTQPIRFKTGKLAPRLDARTLHFKSYLGQLPPTPATVDWTGLVTDWKMLANDTLGDCTIASVSHLIMLWRSVNGEQFIPADADVIATYSALTGYTPSDPSTDQGAVELNILNAWRNTGILGHKISAFVSIDPRNLDHLRAAINLFGGVYAGTLLPDKAMEEFNYNQPWSDTSTQAFDGHAIPLVAYTPDDFTCITWGRKQVIKNAWLQKYLDEAYAPLSPDWLNAEGKSPSGFLLEQLTADLKLL